MKIRPGQTIGILGGGQLGRMLALEARPMGYKILVLDPDSKGPAAQVADSCVKGDFSDAAAAQSLAEQADLVTVETEHIAPAALDAVSRLKPLFPTAAEMKLIQDRLTQKEFLKSARIPQTAFAAVDTEADLEAAVDDMGFPCVLKTRRSGYDGKGQALIRSMDDLPKAWAKIHGQPAVLEAFVKFQKEISVVLARGHDGKTAAYPVAENVHEHHILALTRMPAKISPTLARKAVTLATRVAKALDHVGVMAVEMFVTKRGELLVNEIAPRTHNSGHPTFGASATSQFAQHIRAICGLPMGPTDTRPSAIVNLLGDLWKNGAPNWDFLQAFPSATLHLYGKADARPGRKMGHILIQARTADEAVKVGTKILKQLKKEKS